MNKHANTHLKFQDWFFYVKSKTREEERGNETVLMGQVVNRKELSHNGTKSPTDCKTQLIKRFAA